MAFPRLFENFFEWKTTAWTETDTANRGAIFHISEVSDLTNEDLTPLRGNGIAVVDCRRSNASDAYWSKTLAASSGKFSFAFFPFLTEDLKALSGDTMVLAIVDMSSTDLVVVAQYTDQYGWRVCLDHANIGGHAFDENYSVEVDPGSFEHLCIHSDLDANTAQFFVNDEPIGGTVDIGIGSINGFSVGVRSMASTIQGGLVAIGGAVVDGTDRVKPYDGKNADPLDEDMTLHVAQSSTVFVGGGTINNVTLLAGSNAATLTIYDTDRAETTEGNLVDVLGCPTNETDRNDAPYELTEGAYAVLTGTDARAIFQFEPEEADREELAEFARELEKPDTWD